MTISYSEIREAMKGEPYTMTLVGREIELVTDAVNQGIDAHLEVCYAPERGDKYLRHFPMDIQPCERFPKGASLGEKLDCVVSPESLPVLLRRLLEVAPTGDGEDGDDADVASMLVSDILDTLEIDNETGCTEIVSDVDLQTN